MTSDNDDARLDTIQITREKWCEYLAQADSFELNEIVDKLLQLTNAFAEVRLLRPAQTGTAQLIIREPIVEERFILGDSLVTVAEVSFRGTMGWAMRLGSDHQSTISAAVADAILASGDAELSTPILAFVEKVRQKLDDQSRRQWAMVSATAISFEELD